MTTKVQSTGHSCVRFIYGEDYIPIMDSQQTILDFSKPLEPDLTSERNVESPLVLGAKKFCKCGCGNKVKGWNRNLNKPHEFIRGHNGRINEKYNNLKISDDSKQILIGSLLGDATLVKGFNTSYSCTHGYRQKDYLIWKKEILNLPSYNLYEGKHKVTGNDYYAFCSKRLHQLNKYYDIFYPNGKKVVTREILDELDLLGVAIWYMDDGSYNYKNNIVYLSTDCFSLEEHKLIQKWFIEKYGIQWRIQENKKRKKFKYRLGLNVDNTKRFLKLIQQFIIPLMKYKLGTDIVKKEKCKKKAKIAQQQYYITNRGKILMRVKKYRQENLEKVREYDKNRYSKRYWSNRNEWLIRGRNWKLKNKSKIRIKNKIYRETHKEQIGVYNKKYKIENRDKNNKQRRNHRQIKTNIRLWFTHIDSFASFT